MFRTFRHTLLNAIYPPVCLICDAELPDMVHEYLFCDRCRTVLATDPLLSCPRCTSTVGPGVDVSEGCPRCRDERYSFTAAFRFGLYDGPLRDAILRMKTHTGDTLAATMARFWVEQRRAQFDATGCHAIVPVPHHWWRQLRRGHNPAASLACTMGTRLAKPVTPVLKRVRDTPAQQGLSGAARRENVKDAFALRRGAMVSKMHVLLIDDVLTTGATADAASRALLRGGAAQVTVAVLAHR